MLTLYHSPGSCALASHIALEEAGAEYRVVKVDLGSGAQRQPDYLAINPKGRVPALATDRGILTETPAILAFIAQRFPESRLAPLDDAFAFAEMQAFNAYLCSTVHVAHAHGRRGSRWASEQSSFDDMKRKVPETMGAAMALIENDMLRGPWIMGDQYTIADPYFYVVSTWLKGDGVDIETLPRIADFKRRMEERSSVKKALRWVAEA
ncbi:MAG: Glutathione S-transferase [Pseudomonadota bacterium]|jgi:glutathione S-transferase